MVKPSAVVFAVLVVSALLTGAASAHASCYSTGEFNDSRLCWNPLRPLPAAFELEDVIWTTDRNEFLAVGGGGALLTSTDGQEWTALRTGFVQRLYGAMWDGTRYVLVGEGGLILTGTPEDGWTPRVTNTRLALFGIAWNGLVADPLYLAVGQNGTVLRSRDAEQWEARSIGIGEDGTLTVTDEALGAQQRPAPTLLGVTWGSGRFVAVGSSTTVISTANGATFLAHVHEVAGTPLYDVAVSPAGAFAAVGDRGSFLKAQDHDWSALERSEAFGNATLRGIAWDPELLAFRVVGTADPDDPNASALILQLGVSGSLSGENEFEGAAGVRLRGIAADTARAVAVARGALLTLNTEGLWVPVAAVPPPPVRDLHAVIRVDNVPGVEPFHLAAGAQGTLLRSTGATGWDAIDDEDLVTPRDLNGLARNDDAAVPRIVAAGQGGLLLWSPDGDAWNPPAGPPPVFDIAAVTFGTGGFVAVGADGGIVRSADGRGESWTVSVSPGAGTTVSLNDVTWGDGPDLYVAVGASGTIVTSLDGDIIWTPATSGTDQPLNAVTWTGERFVAVGTDGTGTTPEPLVLTSPDGSAWTRVSELALPADVGAGLVDVAWNGSQLIASLASDDGDGGGFLRSDNGAAWTVLSVGNDPGRDTAVNALVADGRRVLAVGAGGLILESGEPDVTLSVVALNPANVDDLPQFARAGEPKTFRFNVANIGNLDATGVQFNYVLPAGVLFADPPFAVDTTECQAFTDRVQCVIGRAAAGGSGAGVTIAINVIPGDDVESIDTLAQITTLPADINPANDQMTFVTAIGPPEGPTLPSPDVAFVEGGALDWVWLLPLLWWAMRGRRRAAPAH